MMIAYRDIFSPKAQKSLCQTINIYFLIQLIISRLFHDFSGSSRNSINRNQNQYSLSSISLLLEDPIKCRSCHIFLAPALIFFREKIRLSVWKRPRMPFSCQFTQRFSAMPLASLFQMESQKRLSYSKQLSSSSIKTIIELSTMPESCFFRFYLSLCLMLKQGRFFEGITITLSGILNILIPLSFEIWASCSIIEYCGLWQSFIFRKQRTASKGQLKQASIPQRYSTSWKQTFRWGVCICGQILQWRFSGRHLVQFSRKEDLPESTSPTQSKLISVWKHLFIGQIYSNFIKQGIRRQPKQTEIEHADQILAGVWQKGRERGAGVFCWAAVDLVVSGILWIWQ